MQIFGVNFPLATKVFSCVILQALLNIHMNSLSHKCIEIIEKYTFQLDMLITVSMTMWAGQLTGKVYGLDPEM